MKGTVPWGNCEAAWREHMHSHSHKDTRGHTHTHTSCIKSLEGEATAEPQWGVESNSKAAEILEGPDCNLLKALLNNRFNDLFQVTKASYASWSSSCFSKEYARGWIRAFPDTIRLNPPPWRLVTLRSWVQPPLRPSSQKQWYLQCFLHYRAVKPR